MGAGIDDETVYDRYTMKINLVTMVKKFMTKIKIVRKVWQDQLEKL